MRRQDRICPLPSTADQDELQQQLDSSLKHYSMVYDHMPSLWKKLGSLIRIAAKYRDNMRF